MQLGSLSFSYEGNNMKGRVISTIGIMTTKLMFKGNNFHKKIEEKEAKKIYSYWFNGHRHSIMRTRIFVAIRAFDILYSSDRSL